MPSGSTQPSPPQTGASQTGRGGSIRIATRASRQATTQASIVASAIEALGVDTELVFVDTFGDQTQAAEVPLHSIGGQGVFVKAVQQAVLDDRADIAVHSAKDLPTAEVDGLTIGAFCERRSPNDALIGTTLANLIPGAVIATGSVRRRSQLARVRPDLRFVELRGNIDTRVAKLPDEGAVVVARAALELLDLTDLIVQDLDPFEFVPAVGQGCVAIEHRADDGITAELATKLDHPPTRAAVEVERAFLAQLGTGCSAPVGALCVGDELVTYLATTEGTSGRHDDAQHFITERVRLSDDHAANCSLAAELARKGADLIAAEAQG